MVGRIFYEIYHAQKEHKLSTIVEHSNPNYKDAYNEILDFIHNMRLSEIANLGFHYVQDAKEKHGNQEDIVWAEYLTATATENIGVKSSAMKVYKNLFPKGKYIELLELLETPE